MFQRRASRQFDAFSADIDAKASTGVYLGLSVLAFSRNRSGGGDDYDGKQTREGANVAYSGIQVALSPESTLMYRVLRKFQMSDWSLVPNTDYTGGPVTLGVRLADRRKERFEILVNNQVALSDIHIPTLATRGRGIELQIFSQASINRPVSFHADNIRIVTLKSR